MIASSLSKEEYTQTEIARIIGCHQSTISKELSRNRGLEGLQTKAGAADGF
jgi:IS30 family transposase